MKLISHSRSKDTLPIKQVLAALASVRRCFRRTVTQYIRAIEGEIAHVAKRVDSEAEQVDQRLERARDLRDILLLTRDLGVKPDKGRRRDLKRIEGLLDELRSTWIAGRTQTNRGPWSRATSRGHSSA